MTHPRTRRAFVARAALLPSIATLLGGCGGDGGSRDLTTVRDSAGVTIVENAFPDSADVDWWAIEPVPLVDIGGAEAEDAYALFQVGDARRLSDGRIVVTNGSTADVRYFTAAGAHIRTTGRRGGGPGEFQRPSTIVTMAARDSILVTDIMAGRASVLDPDGSFVRDFSFGAAGPGIGINGRIADDTFTATFTQFDPQEPVQGRQRPPVTIITLAADGSVVDTLLSVPGAERVINVAGQRGQITSIEIRVGPFAKSTLFATGDDALFVGTQDAAQIDVFAPDGTLRRIIRTGAPMPDVTPDHIEAWYDRTFANAPAEIRAQQRGRREDPNAADVVPPYGSLEVDDDGYLWVADYDDRLSPAGAWSVYDEKGRIAARIRLPERFRLTHAGDDFVLGVLRDDDDVEHVRLYRLRKDD